MIDLRAFCCSERDKLKNPFSLNNYSYATNGKVCVRVDRLDEFCDLPLIDILALDFYSSSGEYVKLPVYDNPERKCSLCSGSGEVCECGECEGEGIIEFSTDYNCYEAECKSCNGNQVQSGGHLVCYFCCGVGALYENEHIDSGDIRISKRQLDLIKKLPNPLINFKLKKDGYLHIKFDGGVALLMPMLK